MSDFTSVVFMIILNSCLIYTLYTLRCSAGGKITFICTLRGSGSGTLIKCSVYIAETQLSVHKTRRDEVASETSSVQREKQTASDSQEAGTQSESKGTEWVYLTRVLNMYVSSSLTI